MQINEEILQDIINIKTGLFAPLDGFMDSADYRNVVDSMKLSSGEVWTIPITLGLDEMTSDDMLELVFEDRVVATLEVEDVYKVKEEDIKKIFGTDDSAHPGVKKELQKGSFRVGGKITLVDESILEGALNPQETKEHFKKMGYKTIAGFQTRNPIHKAHEHLQRVALEICDALFINPLVGWKKAGDFSEEAVISGYKAMIDEYYNGLNVYFDTLKTPMRYAGPREAIFHAIIRRNLGCTHFIIGRDHAGVGGYYGKYEAQELARKIIQENDLGITLLLLSEPFYCKKCEQMVSDKTCKHSEEFIQKISGTQIRAMLSEGKRPSELFMRAEVADAIISLKERKFIQG